MGKSTTALRTGSPISGELDRPEGDKTGASLRFTPDSTPEKYVPHSISELKLYNPLPTVTVEKLKGTACSKRFMEV
jgi:hypothetical protein